MCPDRQILSVYLDQELPSPWKEKLEDHLAACPLCRDRLAQYQRASAFLGNSEPTALAAETTPLAAAGSTLDTVGERVWQNITLRHGGAHSEFFRDKPVIWRRSVPVPFPIAVAAAAVLALSFAAVFRNIPSAETPSPDSTLAAGLDLGVQGIVPASDFDGVLQYLGQSDTPDLMLIRLPESRNFMSSGEPTIINASDYSRSTPPR
jgi:hypothetical protein